MEYVDYDGMKKESEEAPVKPASAPPDLDQWITNAAHHGGGFLKSFVECWRKADLENQRLLRPVLLQLAEKYPWHSDAWQDGEYAGNFNQEG